MPSEKQILHLLNSTQTAGQIVDASHAFSGVTITLQQGQCIINLRDSLPNKRFTSLDQLRGHCGFNDDTIERLPVTVRTNPTKDYPVLLLPIRLETRFINDKLLVRIYPDKISITTHEELLTREEYESGIRYYRVISQNASEDEKRQAWKRLASTFGPRRAAWIRKTMLVLKPCVSPEHEFDPQIRPEHEFDPHIKPEIKRSSWTQAPRVYALPDKFAVYLYRKDKLFKGPLYGERVESNLSLIAAPKLDQTDLFDSKSDWVFDFNRALACGMALEISFSDKEIIENKRHGISRIVVVGLRSTTADDGIQMFEQLIENHHYTNGFAFLEPGTPTNNTQKAKSGYCDTKEDYPESYQTEVTGPLNWEDMPSIPRNNAHLLGHALGLGSKSQTLRYIELADDMRDSYSKNIRAALWPATSDYFLFTMLPGLLDEDALNDLSHHFSHYVHAGGPLPAIRVGDQPYGILPVSVIRPNTDVKAGLFENTDIEGLEYPIHGEFEDKLAFYLIKLAVKWLQYARNPDLVPRVNATDDPDKELIQLLAMEPTSITYRARPFVDERFVAFLLVAVRDFVFGPGTPYEETNQSPEYWVKQWGEVWKEKQAETADVLHKLSGKSLNELKEHPLLKTLGWWEGMDQPLNYTIGENPDDEPLTYLLSLCNLRIMLTESTTLLFNLIKRSLKLEQQKHPPAYSALSAIYGLISRAPLEFFNTVDSPREIMLCIKDKPEFDEALKSWCGIDETVAKRIIETRDALPGKCFTSMQQIESINGIGKDKMRGIYWSFQDYVQDLDYDRLLRETLDLCTHRLDAWLTSIVTKRMEAMRLKKNSGIYIGAYGWIENLKPDTVKAKPDERLSGINSGASDRIINREPDRAETVRYENPLDLHNGTNDCNDGFSPAESIKSEGFIHAPSAAQAATAAVLHNAYLTHDYTQSNGNDSGNISPNPFRINLNSERVRNGLRILEGVRQGQNLGALLGYQFERSLHEPQITHTEIVLPQYIDDFRSAFPTVVNKEKEQTGEDSIEAIAARNVVDGLALARAWRTAIKKPSNHFAYLHKSLEKIGNQTELRPHLNDLLESLDCVSDLLVHEGVYQAVQGNFDRGGAALEAAAGNLNPPQIESIKTPVAGRTFSQRACLLFYEPDDETNNDNPMSNIRNCRKLAEPRIAAWFERLLGDMSVIGCGISFESLCININTATSEEFITLPVIGEETADKIITYRRENGPFESIDHFAKVLDISDDKVADLADWITVDPDPVTYKRINLNTAPMEVLQKIPGIGEEDAEKIINYRVDTKFKKISDLINVEGIDDRNIIGIRPFVTTGSSGISLTDLGIDAIDMLYLSATPPGGDETELDRRIKYYTRNEHGLSFNTPISIDYNDHDGYASGISDAIEVGRYALYMLNDAGYLRPEMLSRSSLAEEALFKQDDVNELKNRIENKLLPLFNKTIEDLDNRNIPDSGNEEELVRADIISALFDAAYLGISAAIPAGFDEPSKKLEERRSTVCSELKKRLKKYRIAKDQSSAAGDNTKAISKLIEAVKALLGPGFIVLPSFTLKRIKEFSDSIQNNPIVIEDEQIRSWLQQTSSTHPPLQDINSFLMISEAWKQSALNNGDYPLFFHVAQLPREAAETWLGIEHGFDATSTRYQGETLSLVTVLSQPVSQLNREEEISSLRVSGILVDQWDEFLPSDTINTSIAFHYDAPGTQAPQSLLLAVPDKISSNPEDWKEDDLAAIVSDTLDLAKIRTVDIDALKETAAVEGEKPDMGAILPAVMLPVDQKNPGWERNVVMNLFEDWVDVLTPFKCHGFRDASIEDNAITFDCGLRISELLSSPTILEGVIGLKKISGMMHSDLLRLGGAFKTEFPVATHKVSFQIGWLDWQCFTQVDDAMDYSSEELNDRYLDIHGYNSNGDEIDITDQRELSDEYAYLDTQYGDNRYVSIIAEIVIKASDLKVLIINFGATAILYNLCFAGFGCDHD